MLLALVPFLMPLLAGTALPAVIAGTSLATWAALGDAILTAAPGEIEALKKLDPFFVSLVGDVQQGKNRHSAAASAVSWLARNDEGAIKASENRESEDHQ